MCNNQPCPDAADARPFILCIDDDSIWELILAEAARRLGARVVFVEDPDAFKRLAKEQSPAGVIVDQIMPDSTGSELNRGQTRVCPGFQSFGTVSARWRVTRC